LGHEPTCLHATDPVLRRRNFGMTARLIRLAHGVERPTQMIQ